MRWFFKHLAAPLLALVLLGGMFGTQSLHLSPEDAGDYHQRVQEAMDAVPYVVGEWIGREVPVPVEATELLRPNALLSREYVHSRTGQRVHVMLVHCLDARDLQGHYPPVCYPAVGWRVTDHDVRDMPAAGRELPVAHYQFERRATMGTQELAVMNLMVLPDGTFGTDMRSVDQVAGSHALRHLGAGQLQILPSVQTTPEEQAALWSLFHDALEPAMTTIQRGTGSDR